MGAFGIRRQKQRLKASSKAHTIIQLQAEDRPKVRDKTTKIRLEGLLWAPFVCLSYSLNSRRDRTPFFLSITTTKTKNELW